MIDKVFNWHTCINRWHKYLINLYRTSARLKGDQKILQMSRGYFSFENFLRTSRAETGVWVFKHTNIIEAFMNSSLLFWRILTVVQIWMSASLRFISSHEWILPYYLIEKKQLNRRENNANRRSIYTPFCVRVSSCVCKSVKICVGGWGYECFSYVC